MHVFPSWVGDSLVAFEDKGVTAIHDNSVEIDPDRAGVIVYNLVSRQHHLVLPHASYPGASRDGDVIVAVAGHNLVAYVDSTISEIDEVEQWTNRSSIAVDDTGQLLAWRSSGADHAVGVWTFDRHSLQYRFLGRGADPDWKPGQDVVLYRASDGAGTTCLVEYRLGTAHYDTLYRFPATFSGRHFSYSPNGDKVAFFRISTEAAEQGLCTLDITAGEIEQHNGNLGVGLDWNDDGIIYTNGCYEIDNEGCGVLWLLDLDTGQEIQVSDRMQFTR